MPKQNNNKKDESSSSGGGKEEIEWITRSHRVGLMKILV